MKNKISIISILVGFVTIIALGIDISYAQENDEYLIVSSNFEMLESSEDFGIMENSSSVEIDLISPNWTITEINLNFTSIMMNYETKIIEQEDTDFETLKGNSNEILGMQINITEPTIIYAVEIFGYKSIKTASPSPVYVQINGWDSIDRRPNGINYSVPIELNMTEGIPLWNKQIFRTPLRLSSGQYCLVLNGTGTSLNDKYYWYINNDNPTSLLSMCMFDNILDEWQNRTGDVFLHKLTQRVNRSYFPSEINMTAEIGGDSYIITDGLELGSGELFIENLDLYILDSTIDIHFKNNLSISLLLNLNYHISFKHKFYSEGSGLLRENLENRWTISPKFRRIYSSYSIKFYYPKSWYNIAVYRNGLNVTSEVVHNKTEKSIFISNSTIKDDELWSITAYSPNMNFNLNIGKTNYEPLQNLKFSVILPIIEGEITYILKDSYGFEEFRDTKPVTSQETLFCCNISANPIAGIYKAYIYWYNNTDGGVETQEFTISVPFTIPLEVIRNSVLLILIILGGSITSYFLVKRNRRIKSENQQKIMNKFTDTLNMQYLIISDRNSGLTVYEKYFTGKYFDSALISGFLQAVRAFGIELTDAEDQSRSVKLDYQRSKILMSDYKNTRIILIMEKNPSQVFLNSLNALLYDIEEKLGHLLIDFDGDITQFSEIRNLLEIHFQISLISPLKLNLQHKQFASDEQILINRALKIMNEKNENHFFVSALCSKEKGIDIKYVKTILNLIENKVFQPFTKKFDFIKRN